MSKPSQFASWLAQLARDGRFGLELPGISRGRQWAATLSLAEHPTLGDYTSGVFAMVARAAPDAAGDPLATFTCTTGTPASNITPVSLGLAASAQGDIPPGGDDGLVELYWEITYTLGGVAYPIAGGNIFVAGAI